MGWDNAGGYNRQHNFSADASSGIKILAARMDAELDDFASAMTIALTRNGQNVPTVNLPMGGFRHINVGAPTSVNNYMRSREFIENVPIFMHDQESSADRVSVSAQYFTSVSANQAPGDGTRIIVRAKSTKASAVVYLNGHSANVEFQDGTPAIGAMVSGGVYEFIFSSVDSAWKIQNPGDGRTAAEISAGVTPTNYRYPPGNVLRYGADPTGVADSTTAFQNAARAVNGSSSSGSAAGGYVFVPIGTYLVSRIGIRGTVFEGESMIGTVINGTGSGAASEFMFDAALDLDGSTANTDGQRGYCREMTIDANGSGRSLIRTYGDLVAPERLILRDAIASGAIGLSLGLPIMATAKNIRAINCDIGFFTYAAAAQDATSTTFIGCWADTCLTDGFRMTQLNYSSWINCAAQDCGTNNWYFDGSSNGVGTMFSLQVIGCASEGTGVPFLFEDCREVTIVNPRVINADSGQDLLLLDDFTGTIIDFSTAGALAGGALHLSISNHNGGEGAIVIAGGDVTYDTAEAAALTLSGARANGLARGTSTRRLVLDGAATAAELLASQDDYAITSHIMRLSAPGGGATITGLANGTSYPFLMIFNVSANNITLNDSDGSSLAANQLLLGGNITVGSNEGITLWYDSASSRWRSAGRSN